MARNIEQNQTKKLTVGALFVALGVLFPYVMGHAFGVPGTILLPMHLPVLIAGLILGPKLGLAVGILSPIASSLLTGMPPLWPMLPQMIVELGVFGLVGGYLKTKTNTHLSLLGAMIAGRIARGVIFAFIMMPVSAGFVVESVIATTIMGFPGIIMQLVFVPIAVDLLEKHLKFAKTTASNTTKTKDVTLQAALDAAIAEINNKNHSFVLIKGNEIVYKTSGRGVKPFLELLATDEGRNLLKGSIVVDKLIGKGAAMLAVYGEVESVYGITMSESGRDVLNTHDKFTGHTRCVEVISKKDGKGICPIERSVLDVTEPAKAYKLIKDTVAELMKMAQ